MKYITVADSHLLTNTVHHFFYAMKFYLPEVLDHQLCFVYNFYNRGSCYSLGF